MTTGINIYSEPGVWPAPSTLGFESILFFPGAFATTDWHASISGGTGYFSYKAPISQITFRIEFTGHDFHTTAPNDFSCIATGLKVAVQDGDSWTTMAEMVIFPHDSNYDGVIINSAAWLTPNNLLNTLQNLDRGGHLGFLGNTERDALVGSDRGDYFNGEGGNDTLTGNGGYDEFLFDRVGKADADHITDFTLDIDKILIDRSDDPAQFRGVTAANLERTFHDITLEVEQRDDRIIYNHRTGTLSYDPDGSGQKVAQVFAYIDNHVELDANQFEMF